MRQMDLVLLIRQLRSELNDINRAIFSLEHLERALVTLEPATRSLNKITQNGVTTNRLPAGRPKTQGGFN